MAFSNLPEEIAGHLAEVTLNAQIPLDVKLLEKCDRIFAGTLDSGERKALLNQLSALLPALQQDPTPATTLIENLIKDDSFTFGQVLEISPPVDFVTGLQIPSSPVNHVTLALLNKATLSAGDAGIVAGKPELVAALVSLWLQTTETLIAVTALEVLTRLVYADLAPRNEDEDQDTMELDLDLDDSCKAHPGQGLMVRRLLKDKDIYSLLFSFCSHQTVGQEGQPDKRKKTIAQARLLDLLIEFHSFEQFRTSQVREVEEVYGVEGGGLLEFAALRMVDYKDDLLMHMTLIDFFTCIIGDSSDDVRFSKFKRLRTRPQSSSLDFMITTGLHARTMSYYLTPEDYSALDLSCLYGKSAEYIATYASRDSAHFLEADSTLAEKVVLRLFTAIEQVSSSQWAHNNGPKHDLNLLAHLPRLMLLPNMEQYSPFLLLSTKAANADVFNVLATVFRGPLDVGPNGPSTDLPQLNPIGHERSAARALYFLYVQDHPNLWRDVVAAAEIVAVKENALAAIHLIQALINANWVALPEDSTTGVSSSPFHLPTERELETRCRTYHRPLPPQGALSLLLSPALEVIFPYLMQPAKSFSGRGDAESAAYEVAAVKHDTMILLHSKLEALAEASPEGETNSWQDLVSAVSRRIRNGPMGASTEVGGRIATLDG